MNSKHEAPDRIWLEYSQDEQHLHLTDELVWTGYLTEYVKAETVRQAATEQGVVPVSNPDLCPIFKDRQVIPDEDWCGPCREEFYDTVMESGDTDSPAEQGVGEAVAEFGKGDWIVEVGKYGDKPTVFVAPADPPGVPGELAPPTSEEDKYRLLDGEWFMTFPTEAQAFAVADALTGRKLKRLDGTRPDDAKPTGGGVPDELRAVSEVMDEYGGWWSTCSGCFDTVDGHATGPYPHSKILHCTLGSGCDECGGIGAVWNSGEFATLLATQQPPGQD